MADYQRIAQAIRRVALAYPGTYEEMPWGDRVVKVRGKIFLFCDAHEDRVSLGVKLPQSGDAAISLSLARPARYGLGKSGWVSTSFRDPRNVPMPMIRSWIDESYRAIAPKRLTKAVASPKSDMLRIDRPSTRRSRSVLLVGHDRFRLERAAKALRAMHWRVSQARLPQASDLIAAMKGGVVVLDAGRSRTAVLSLAELVSPKTKLVVCGVTDGRLRREVARRLPRARNVLPEAPGEQKVIDSIEGVLAR
jgi:predicted DNA-binding protein (MmcQ/YjbR family)